MKHLLKTLALTLALAALPVFALAQTTEAPADELFGSAGIDPAQTYTLEEMLDFALQDEYLAKAEYEAIQEAFGVNNPFANIMKAEVTHQEELLVLFEAYGFAVTENTAADHIVIPATLQETYETGVAAEIANIAMYELFLSQEGLPEDVRDVFTALMQASQSHLEAFSRNAEKNGSGLGNGMEQGRNEKQDGTQTAEATVQTQPSRGGRWN